MSSKVRPVAMRSATLGLEDPAAKCSALYPSKLTAPNAAPALTRTCTKVRRDIRSQACLRFNSRLRIKSVVSRPCCTGTYTVGPDLQLSSFGNIPSSQHALRLIPAHVHRFQHNQRRLASNGQIFLGKHRTRFTALVPGFSGTTAVTSQKPLLLGGCVPALYNIVVLEPTSHMFSPSSLGMPAAIINGVVPELEKQIVQGGEGEGTSARFVFAMTRKQHWRT